MFKSLRTRLHRGEKTISISQRITSGWAVLAKGWVVERPFAQLNHYRRLSKDYEIKASSTEFLIIIAHSMTLLPKCEDGL